MYDEMAEAPHTVHLTETIRYMPYDGGIFLLHWHGDETWCGTMFPFSTDLEAVAADDKLWRLVNADPLSIAPSLICECKELHGFIFNGQWDGDLNGAVAQEWGFHPHDDQGPQDQVLEVTT